MDVIATSPGEALQQAHTRSLYTETDIQTSAIRASQTLPTETAVAAFTIMTGIGSAVSNLLAAGRLSGLEASSIHVSEMALPVGVIIAGAIAGAFLMPGGTGGAVPTGIPTMRSPYDKVGARRLMARQGEDEEDDRWDY